VATDMGMAARMSAVVQGVGYCVAALAPSVVGFVHGSTHSWTPPLLLLLGSVLAFMVCTTLAVRKVR